MIVIKGKEEKSVKLTLTDLLLVAMIAFLIFERACRVEDTKGLIVYLIQV